mmetsp:Transcript_8646/g.25986  ORF Transcript_8646/g.25986 Transcript_8646/m.25986 type:complete len:339 (+) Transcript_8646:81-1097(+)
MNQQYTHVTKFIQDLRAESGAGTSGGFGGLGATSNGLWTSDIGGASLNGLRKQNSNGLDVGGGRLRSQHQAQQARRHQNNNAFQHDAANLFVPAEVDRIDTPHVDMELEKHKLTREKAAESSVRRSATHSTRNSSISDKKRSLENTREDQLTTNSFSSGASDDERQTNMSVPERKREREKRRRELMNTRFSELALMLPRINNGKSDKESILAEAVENTRRQNNYVLELNMQNQALKTEIEELRTEKNELRADKVYLRAELAAAREDIKNLKSDHMMLWELFKQRINTFNGGNRSGAPDALLDVALRSKLLQGVGMQDLGQILQQAESNDKATSHNECA